MKTINNKTHPKTLRRAADILSMCYPWDLRAVVASTVCKYAILLPYANTQFYSRHENNRVTRILST